jgi:hypothetical protein
MNETYTDIVSLEVIFDMSRSEDTFNCEDDNGYSD